MNIKYLTPLVYRQILEDIKIDRNITNPVFKKALDIAADVSFNLRPIYDDIKFNVKSDFYDTYQNTK